MTEFMLHRVRCSWHGHIGNLLVLGLLATLLPSCGGGTVALSGGGGSSGGKKAAAPISVILDIPEPAAYPAALEVTVIDSRPKPRPQDVVLEFEFPPGTGRRPMNLSAGESGKALPSGAGGVLSVLHWEYEGDLGSTARTEGVTVFARVEGKGGLPGESLAMGNDPAIIDQVTVVDTTGQSTGPVHITFRVRDTGGHPVQVTAGFKLPEDSTLNPATLALSTEFESSAEGVTGETFWVSNQDASGIDETVEFVLAADDGFTPPSELITSQPIGIELDNNAPPDVTLLEAAFVTNPDEHRGIPVPLLLTDLEKDPVQVIVQWGRPGETFRALPENPAALKAVLADPTTRRELRIATELPTFARGRLKPVSDVRVVVPELASSQAELLPVGVDGRTLQILRNHRDPRPIADSWPANPLLQPVAAVPVFSGASAMVLDWPAAATWRLQHLALATGNVFNVLVDGAPGTPSALAIDPDQQFALVGSHIFGAWRLSRVNLATGERVQLASFDVAPVVFGPIRAIAPLGDRATAFVAGDSLVHVEHGNPLDARVSVLASGLAQPVGLAVDPADPRRLILAERGPGDCMPGESCGAIRSFDLTTHELITIPQFQDGVRGSYLRRPRSVAFAGSSTRLLVATEPINGGVQVQEFSLGARGGFEVSPTGWPLPSPSSALATGRDNLTVLAMPQVDDLAVGGGVVQARVITPPAPNTPAYEAVTATLTVAPPFSPLPEAGQLWRIDRTIDQFTSRLVSQGATFVWDARDIVSGDVVLRVEVRDLDIGGVVQTTGPKEVSFIDEMLTLQTGMPGTPAPSDVRARDLDGDGDLDIVMAVNGGDDVYVFLQIAPGMFGAVDLLPGTLTSPAVPHALAVADVDGDQLADVLVGNAQAGGASLFTHELDGSFTADPVNIGSGATHAVHLAELTGDGLLDVVTYGSITDTEARLTVFAQQVDGSFASQAEFTLPNTGSPGGPRSISTINTDGDGDLDIVLGGSGTLCLFRQGPDGVFTRVDIVQQAGSPLATDIDRDGDLDLAVSDVGKDEVRIYKQTQSGGFEIQADTLGSPLVMADPVAVAPLDLEGDGDLDLVTANAGSDDLGVFVQSGEGRFDPTPTLIGNATVTDAVSAVDGGDIDGDGRADLVGTNATDGSTTVFLQARPGVFRDPPEKLGGVGATTDPTTLLARDMNGDGDLDLLTVHSMLDHVVIIEQTLPGFFEATPKVVGGTGLIDGPVDAEGVDIDGDSLLDLVTANAQGNDITIFRQTPASPGNFTLVEQRLGDAASTGSPRALAVGDLDGDGDRDIVAVSAGTHTVTVFRQEGGGLFDPTPHVHGGLATTNTPIDVAIADLDDDGLNDIATVNIIGRSLTIFFGTESGFPAEPDVTIPSLAGESAPFAIRIADLDLDGDLDLIVADRDRSALVLVTQTAPRSFEETDVLGVRQGGGPAGAPGHPRGLAAADLDLDGDLDLAAAGFDIDALQVFEQIRPGVFRLEHELGNSAATSRPFSVELADLDGDGELDLVSANQGGGNVSVYWNGH